MREILEPVARWFEAGEQVALATVIQTWGSSPRRVGAKMAFTPGGSIAGSVSGGCVEGAVFEEGLETLKSGIPKLLKYGVADETAWTVGLACGGKIEVFVRPLSRERFEQMRAELETNRRFATATVIAGPQARLGEEVQMNGWGDGSLALEGMQGALLEKARRGLESGRSEVSELVWEGESLQVFTEVFAGTPTLVIVGGVHISVALAKLAQTSGFQVAVVDPRRAFANRERFPTADKIFTVWPQEAFEQFPLTEDTAVTMLTHDPKIDDPALLLALQSPAFYVGALGSQKTQADRRRRLLEAGLSEAQLSRLHGPIGLDLGAETPEEIALAILAQIVQARRKGSAQAQRRVAEKVA